MCVVSFFLLLLKNLLLSGTKQKNSSAIEIHQTNTSTLQVETKRVLFIIVMLFLKHRFITTHLLARYVRIKLHNSARACEVLSVFCREHLKKVTALRLAVARYAAARAAVVMAIQGCLATEIADVCVR